MCSGKPDGLLDPMPNRVGRLTDHVSDASLLRPPGTVVTIPAGTNPITKVTTRLNQPIIQTPTAPNANKQQTSDLTAHLASTDNRLWQATTSLQSQSNSIINNQTDWTYWNPKHYNENNDVLANEEFAGYYMISWQTLYLEAHGNITLSGHLLQLDLPMDVGEIIIKTCAAYLMYPVKDVPNGVYPVVNAVVGVDIQKMLLTIYVNPEYTGLKCTLALGGAVGIIQG